jgi:hypothetical protein
MFSKIKSPKLPKGKKVAKPGKNVKKGGKKAK